MKVLNSHILRELYYESPQSIASLSNRTKKSIPIVTKVIQELLIKDLIKDEGLARSNGGRRACQYALNIENLPYILLIAIDQHKTVLSIFDFSNTPVTQERSLYIDKVINRDFVQILLEELRVYLNEIGLDKIVAISISTPGFVNTELGINTSYSVEDDRCQIRNILEKEFSKQTFIENDSTVIAIAEHKFGKAKSSKDMLVINLNWGVGLGMIINDKIFKGSSGFAGEFSHIPLSNNNKICSCGKRGCLEVEASLEAALKHAKDKLNKGESSTLHFQAKDNYTTNIYHLFNMAIKGDQLAIESFGTIGYSLGKGIATLIHIINPEKIIISGFGARIGKFLMPQIQSSLLEYSIQRLSEKTKIEISTLVEPQLLGTMAHAVFNLDSKTLQKININKL